VSCKRRVCWQESIGSGGDENCRCESGAVMCMTPTNDVGRFGVIDGPDKRTECRSMGKL